MFCKHAWLSIRKCSRIGVSLNEEFLQQLEKGDVKPRKHLGIQKCGEILVPQWIQNSILKCIEEQPLKKLIDDGNKLSRYITARHPPPEQDLMKHKLRKAEEDCDRIFPPPTDIENMIDSERNQYNNDRTNKIKQILKKRIFAWKPISYGPYESLVYAVGRSALEFTILFKVLSEIKKVDYNFKPRSFFDFGSGVGTGMWAASNLWNNCIFEYFNVDSSRNMNDLADLILREGNNQTFDLRTVFFRQFLPTKSTQYDLVLSSFTLFELYSKKSRSEIILNLWQKCANYLVLVEEGTRNGFELITEARDLILSKRDSGPNMEGYVFAPCSHQYICPRLVNENDKTPCNFEIQYEALSFTGKPKNKSNHLYSYIVMKKGAKSNLPDYSGWQRIVRPTLVRARHTICRLCTSDGKLEEVIFTASKHGKFTYHCARSSCWGDKLPIKIKPS